MKEKARPNWPFYLLTFFVALIGTYAVQVYMNDILGSDNNEIERLAYSANNTYINEEKNNSEDMIEEVMKSVVGISRLQANEESLFDVQVSQKWGLGTGIIVSPNGYILTNQHLAGNVGTRLIVNLDNGKTAQGKVMWAEP